ncbi:hypothetical protein KQX54_009483 [Cotesia glomerata]|uniref:phospholipase A2 n=1 Tax=Cotesia glomerata TaxID=32391 RepID=A0AAV7IVR0_COTGL|nr:hypothetical protein KQX54_009483 [Cotesia glomerata]
MQLFYLLTLLMFYLSIVSTVDIEKKVTNNTYGVTDRLFIFPGTKWCGPGNVAQDNYDLGSDKQVDMCCRDHDLCEPKIRSGETKYGIVNHGRTPLLSCTCDEVFSNCLKAVNSWTSQIIENIYFKLLGRKCFHYNTEK